MKNSISFFLIMSLMITFSGCSNIAKSDISADSTSIAKPGKEYLSILTESKTTQAFSSTEIPSADIETILKAGVNAPSAMNKQPWHFSAIRNKEILQKIADELTSKMSSPPPGSAPLDDDIKTAPQPTMSANKAGVSDAPLAIIISCKDGAEFDSGLACENMSITALSLGYGTKILTSPAIVLNGKNQAYYKELLHIPEDMSVVAVLLIGITNSTTDSEKDGTSGATKRNSLEDMTVLIE